MTADQKRVADAIQSRRHRRLALEAGLSPAIADAIAANQRVTPPLK